MIPQKKGRAAAAGSPPDKKHSLRRRTRERTSTDGTADGKDPNPITKEAPRSRKKQGKMAAG